MMKKIAIISLFITVILLSKANSHDKNSDGGDNGDSGNDNQQNELDNMYCGVKSALCVDEFKTKARDMFLGPLNDLDRNNGSNWLKECDFEHERKDLNEPDSLKEVIERWCSLDEDTKKSIWKCSGEKCVDHLKEMCNEDDKDDENKKEAKKSACDNWSNYLGELFDVKNDAEDKCCEKDKQE